MDTHCVGFSSNMPGLGSLPANKQNQQSDNLILDSEVVIEIDFGSDSDSTVSINLHGHCATNASIATSREQYRSRSYSPWNDADDEDSILTTPIRGRSLVRRGEAAERQAQVMNSHTVEPKQPKFWSRWIRSRNAQRPILDVKKVARSVAGSLRRARPKEIIDYNKKPSALQEERLVASIRASSSNSHLSENSMALQPGGSQRPASSEQAGFSSQSWEEHLHHDLSLRRHRRKRIGVKDSKNQSTMTRSSSGEDEEKKYSRSETTKSVAAAIKLDNTGRQFTERSNSQAQGYSRLSSRSDSLMVKNASSSWSSSLNQGERLQNIIPSTESDPFVDSESQNLWGHYRSHSHMAIEPNVA